MGEPVTPPPADQRQELNLWPDGRYRIFCLLVSAIISGYAGLILTILGRTNLLWMVGLLFVATFAVLDPTVPPNLKPTVTNLIFGPTSGLVTQNTYKWTYRKHRLVIHNQDGDTSAHRVYQLKSKEDKNYIHQNLHGAGFDQGSIEKGNGGYFRCVSDDDRSLNCSVITRSRNHVIFTVEYRPPVAPRDEYEYRLHVPNVKEAYPSEEEEYFYDITILNPVDTLEIEIDHLFRTDLICPELIDRESDQNISSPDTDPSSDRIVDTIEDVGPGHYRLSWEMEPKELRSE